MTKECQKLFSDNSIVETKPPGSTFQVEQPDDTGNISKSIKTTLSKMKTCDIFNNDLEEQLTVAIQASEDSLMKRMTSSIPKKICYALTIYIYIYKYHHMFTFRNWNV